MSFFRKFLAFLILFCWWALGVRAQIVVFPFEDLSRDVNGVNFEIADKIAQQLEKDGLEVVPPREVLSFLAENRIRWTGWVDRITAIKAAREFGADLILVGTVTELQKEGAPALGVTIRLLRVKDYQVVWSRTAVFSGKEEVSFLALKQVNFPEIEEQTVRALVSALPQEIQHGLYQPPEIEIAEVFLKPRRVRGGAELECAVRLDVSGPPPSKIYFLWGGQRIPALKSDTLYVAKWQAPPYEGRYSIKLLADWPAYGLKKELFLSTFIVDNTPPKIFLKTVQGEEINGEVAFNRHIFLIPTFEKSEPISRWLFEIIEEKSRRVVVREERPGNLPPRFTWRGTDLAGHFLPNGKYLARIKVWDLAGNAAEAKRELLLVKGAPSATVVAKEASDKLYIDLEISKHLLPIESWRLELWDEEGNLVGEYEGLGQPKEIILPKKGKIYYSLEVRDTLGNRRFVRYQPLKTIILQASSEKKVEKSEKKWVDDF